MILSVLAAPCLANTYFVSIEPTQMQAIIRVYTDQSGFCTYRASQGTNFSSNLPDLIHNGNTDARVGSVVNGPDHAFVLGTRKADDALANASSYWVGVTCGADPEASQTFSTGVFPWGNTAPDPIPFNAAKWGNRDYPAIDYANPGKMTVDPVAGVPFWVVTRPGWVQGSLVLAAQATGYLGVPIDIGNSGLWTNLANITSNGASFTHATGGPANKAFVPIASGLNCLNNGSGFPLGGWGEDGCTLDDLSFDIYCGNAAVAGETITVQLADDGGTLVGNAFTTSACPTTAPVRVGTLPSLKPNPPFLSWGYQPRKMRAVPPASIGANGVVNVAGSVVTLQNPALPQEMFDADWLPGTPILVNNAYSHIASMQGANKLTLQENVGTLTGVNYSGAAFGVVLTKSSNGNALDISIGVNAAQTFNYAQGFESAFPNISRISVDVTKTADGSQTLSPPLKGYLSYVAGSGSRLGVFIWIPKNTDGSVRNESRFLSYTKKSAASPRFHANGDLFFEGFLQTNAQAEVLFDDLDGTSLYAFDANSGTGKTHLMKLTYDESLPGCAGYVAFEAFTGYGPYAPTNGTPYNDDCFQWTNLTSIAQGKDLTTQIVNAYHTGLNTNGDTVGVAHPGFDLGWMGGTSLTVSGGGYFSGVMQAFQNGMCVIAGFRASDLLLTNISDTWNSGDARFAGCHGLFEPEGATHFLIGHELNLTPYGNQFVFGQQFRSNILQVNRADFGAPAVWDCAGCPGGPNQNTTVAWNEGHNCGTLASPYNTWSNTNNCVQIKVDTPPCQQNPNVSYHFVPSGNTEAVEFPCSTPGFGTTAGKSKLQNFQVGDHLFGTGHGGGTSSDIMVLVRTPTYNATNNIDLWVLRHYGSLFYQPTLSYAPAADNDANHFNSDPWSVDEFPVGWGFAAAYAFAANVGNTTPAKTNPAIAAGHSATGPGTSSNTFSLVSAGSGPGGGYGGYADSTTASQILVPVNDVAPYWPRWACTSPNVDCNDPGPGYYQSYPSLTYRQGTTFPPFLFDFRITAPASGGNEANPATVGIDINVAPVAGTSKSYKLGNGLPGIPLANLDYKRDGILGTAGHFVLKDVSNPSTSNTADLADWSACIALANNQCFTPSTKGDQFVTLPMIDIRNRCTVEQHGQVSPCVYQPGPWSGQAIQALVGSNSSKKTRKFGYLGSLPQEQVGKCRVAPDATMVLCAEPWAYSGTRVDWIAYQIAPFPAQDTVDRTTFVPIPKTVEGAPGASYVRARFGYLENGAGLLHCMPYGQDCSTEIPSGSPTDPYSFTNEAVTPQSCLPFATCKVVIPALSNRVLYYVVDHLDVSGNMVVSKPVEIVAVP